MRNHPKTFTNEIRAAIRAAKANGWKQFMLAREIGVSGGNLSDFTRGVMGLDVRKLDRLAPLLGLSLVVDVDAQRRAAKKNEVAKGD